MSVVCVYVRTCTCVRVCTCVCAYYVCYIVFYSTVSSLCTCIIIMCMQGVHACAYEVLCVSEEIIYSLEIDFPFSLPSDKSLPQC